MKSLQILMMGGGFVQYGKYNESEFDDYVLSQGYVPISTPDELNSIRDDSIQFMGSKCPSKYRGSYQTGADANYIIYKPLDCTSLTNYTGVGETTAPFTGIFLGNNIIISNLTIKYNTERQSFLGLCDGYECYDLFFENIDFTDSSNAVSNGDANVNSIVSNCHVLSGDGYGAMIGGNYGIVENCTMNASISSGGNFIGVVGSNYGTVRYCAARGAFEGIRYVGGIVGYNRSGGIVENCFSYANTHTTVNQSGSLVGINVGGTITNCYSTGSATTDGTIVGGLIGLNYGTVTDSYWDTVASGNATSSGGTGKTTNEMQEGEIPDTAIYISWDDTIWDAVDDNTYPELINV